MAYLRQLRPVRCYSVAAAAAVAIDRPYCKEAVNEERCSGSRKYLDV